MVRICVIALIGLPAAGKTTLCEHLLTLPQLPVNIIHLCFDNFLPNPDKDNNCEFKIHRSRILSLLQSIVDGLKKQSSIPEDKKHKISVSNHNSQDYFIICDDNNYYTSMRYKIFQLCKENQIYFGQIYVVVDATLALQRNSKREKSSQVPPHTVHRMIQRLDVPNATKNAWESLTLTLDSISCESSLTTAIIEFFSKIFEHPLLIHQEEHIHEHIFSANHALDLLLRRRIKELIDSEPSVEIKRNKARILNLKRKQILQSYGRDGTNEEELMNIDKLNKACELLK